MVSKKYVELPEVNGKKVEFPGVMSEATVIFQDPQLGRGPKVAMGYFRTKNKRGVVVGG